MTEREAFTLQALLRVGAVGLRNAVSLAEPRMVGTNARALASLARAGLVVRERSWSEGPVIYWLTEAGIAAATQGKAA